MTRKIDKIEVIEYYRKEKLRRRKARTLERQMHLIFHPDQAEAYDQVVNSFFNTREMVQTLADLAVAHADDVRAWRDIGGPRWNTQDRRTETRLATMDDQVAEKLQKVTGYTKQPRWFYVVLGWYIEVYLPSLEPTPEPEPEPEPPKRIVFKDRGKLKR